MGLVRGVGCGTVWPMFLALEGYLGSILFVQKGSIFGATL